MPLLYIFLKVLLDETQTANDGQVIAEKLMTQLGVKEEDLISGAYMDMIIKQKGWCWADSVQFNVEEHVSLSEIGKLKHKNYFKYCYFDEHVL